ncbi:hypothetical protein GYMLUDRAFT_76469 [Collybiopsis luxurians FD-317 M1]|uniref:SCP domain-containing protein n=1 Tax=Collybiopsis luxurians FD-317 M1 TaxID=944289 RepID=A0A0D0CBU9_9AGAR|nr:hypothetical protein GYMLUDRAFT_76469 [Collybiopsis luxurians FD-317 M1]
MAPLYSFLFLASLSLSALPEALSDPHPVRFRPNSFDHRRHWKRSLNRIRKLGDLDANLDDLPTPTTSPDPFKPTQAPDDSARELHERAQGFTLSTSWSTSWGSGDGNGNGIPFSWSGLPFQSGGWGTTWSTQWTSSPTEASAAATPASSDNGSGGDSGSGSGLSYNDHGDWSTTWESYGSATGAPDPAVTNHDGDGTHGSDTGNLGVQEYLDSHNSVRSQFNVGGLQWNNTLAAVAQQWSNKCNFEHSNGAMGPYGENIAAGTGNYNITTALGDWAAEASQYNPRNPQYSHFTQMVWKDTTQVGCAVQTCDGIFQSDYGPAQFYTCEYYPQGNIIGQFSENVMTN